MEQSESSYFTCGRKGIHQTRSREASILPKGCLAVIAIVVLITVQLSAPVQSASVNKRSTDPPEDCRPSAICGWEVYHPSSRNLQYYVASSCKCPAKLSCFRAEDDISISAYVFRCRDPRRRKVTNRPSNDINEAS